MKTGTGKTYVYIKTLFELNKRYGSTNFIVVVPSVAIREGVKKSFDITQVSDLGFRMVKTEQTVTYSKNGHAVTVLTFSSISFQCQSGCGMDNSVW